MTELPADINEAILEFLSEPGDKPTEADVQRLKDIFQLLTIEKWGQLNTLELILSDNARNEHFMFCPVPKINGGFFGEKIKFDSSEVEKLIRCISTNHDIATNDVSEFMRLMRQISGRALQKKEWNMERVKAAVRDIEKERKDK